METLYDIFLKHSGVGHDENPPGRGSGRYAWGSGENPGQHQEETFRQKVLRMKKQGMTQAEIARALLGVKRVTKDGKEIYATSTDLRARVAIETEKEMAYNTQTLLKLYDECNGNKSEIARRMGVNESNIRKWLKNIEEGRTEKYRSTAEMLKDKIAERGGVIDVGKDSEIYMGITETTKKVAMKMLEDEGYHIYYVPMEQAGTGNKTNIMVLAAPEVTYADVKDTSKLVIAPVTDFSPDQGKTWWTPEYPASLDRDRVFVQYGDKGGAAKDGTIEIRPGVQDLSLGDAQYAQVRIAVDGDKYMKGMAFYSDDIPKGYDIVYNTNKKSGAPDEKVFKPFKHKEIQITDPSIMDANELKLYKKGKPVYREGTEIDTENPFGALIARGGQYKYTDANGQEKLSPINKLREEGEWDKWSRTLASQFLAKQPLKLIDQQLNLSISDKRNSLEEIKSITNPVLRKQMLENFAGKCDSNAADLSAVGFKNQAYQVLLPLNNIKDNEIYAPNFKDGDTVALVRYPHGGTFEIPILKVNNKNKEGKLTVGTGKDAVGINSKVAEKLSGADFDGDTAIVIPMASNRLKITATAQLEGLKGWDNKEGYRLPEGVPGITNKNKQNEMGRVTNLITDMTVGGARPDEICRAVKHSMVVIDAEKHHLDYKKSYKDNDIVSLKKNYQGVADNGQPKGASTILSKANSDAHIRARSEITDRSKMTPEQLKAFEQGKRVYVDKPPAFYKNGEPVYRHETIPKMYMVDDAMELVRDKNNPKEVAYANYANALKRMGEEARREARAIKPTPISPSAQKTYASEVASINEKILKIRANNPKERAATTIMRARVAERLKDTPSIDNEHRRRIEAQEMDKARALVGAGKDRPTLTDREWDAIQSGAISSEKQRILFKSMKQDYLTNLAMPKQGKGLSDSQKALAKSMLASGMYTQADVAERFGVSASTVSRALSNK